MSDSAQIMNQILGLSTKVEQLQTNQEQVVTFLQTTTTQMQNTERLARSTNLTMEGIARKTDDNHAYLHAVDQSIKKLQDTQLDTSSLSEGVHQLISDSFMRLQRYLEQRYPAGQPLDLGQVRAEAKRDLAANLLRQLGQLFDGSDENQATPQSSDFAHLQRRATLLQGEVTKIAHRQGKAICLLDSLRPNTPLFQRIIFPVAEQEKRERIIAELAQHIKSSAQDQQHSDLANQLAEYIAEVNLVLSGLRALRNKLLSVWTEDKFANPTANGAALDLNTVAPSATIGNTAPVDDDDPDVDLTAYYNDNELAQFQVDDATLLFKADQL